MRKFQLGARVCHPLYPEKRGTVTAIDTGGYAQWYVYVRVLWDGTNRSVQIHTSNLQAV